VKKKLPGGVAKPGKFRLAEGSAAATEPATEPTAEAAPQEGA
jgi:hypothetical protein